MPNDAKLGFLVGVAGVIVAAVMFSQQPEPSSPPVVETAAVPSRTATPPAPAATPVEKPRAHPATLPRTREELQGRTASRPADEE
jgi:hypothetical protein